MPVVPMLHGPRGPGPGGRPHSSLPSPRLPRPAPGQSRGSEPSLFLPKHTHPSKRHDVEGVPSPADGVEEVLVAPGGGVVHLELTARAAARGGRGRASPTERPSPAPSTPSRGHLQILTTVRTEGRWACRAAQKPKERRTWDPTGRLHGPAPAWPGLLVGTDH